MSNSEVPISTLKSFGYKARDEHAILGSLDLEGQNVRGCCIEISRFLRDKLIERSSVDKSEFDRVKCQFKGEEMHYFIQINSEYVEGINESGSVYIDPSLDQFCDEQQSIGRVDVSVGAYDDLPRVAIIEPSDPRRRWYQDTIVGV